MIAIDVSKGGGYLTKLLPERFFLSLLVLKNNKRNNRRKRISSVATIPSHE